MSAAASKARAAEVAAPAETEADLPDLVESPGDTHETRMAYDPSSRIPIAVILVWVCAFTCLGIYCASFYYPDLAAWRQP